MNVSFPYGNEFRSPDLCFQPQPTHLDHTNGITKWVLFYNCKEGHNLQISNLLMILLIMLSASRGDSGLLSFYSMTIYDPEKRKGTHILTAWEWDFWQETDSISLKRYEITPRTWLDGLTFDKLTHHRKKEDLFTHFPSWRYGYTKHLETVGSIYENKVKGHRITMERQALASQNTR